MVAACDGRPMRVMHRQLSASGHMHGTQGLAVLARDAGILVDYGAAKSPKAKTIAVHLGTAGHQYAWAPTARGKAMPEVGRRS